MIVLVGMAGSGKSTQGQLLAKDLNAPWVSVGNVLRAYMSGEDAEQMLKGKLVDDQKLLPILDTAFKRIHAESKEFILDGSPRTMTQVKWLSQKIQDKEIKLTGIIHLNAHKAVAKARLLSRGRPDDYEDAIAARFAEYEKVIVPIIGYLKEQGFKIHEINSEQTQEKVAKDIEKALNLKRLV